MGRENGKAKAEQVIDENLKRVYRDMIDDDVPDRFMELLSQLKEQDDSTQGDDNSGEAK
ncbi:NepR family anti-sigma factor [Allosediminivita pacifica]|uniref:Anti-sigma factor NepR domain-containing protein n=1 Tax=Allosediminivita pacifica TaxID=1267769 RepID=A0A2T6AV35_9RHOB|nr:NepR family anti-sigma factor [Allosediminivita pacifica]PTX47680.1 hypothetical protein C8N44_1118 [Allosediminivita pacifica]GGB13661.1 hypothetical protein GCM10011324_24790 [Allosediminivita pacifica]